MLSTHLSSLSHRPSLRRTLCSFATGLALFASFPVLADQSGDQTLTSEQALARLSLKHVSYSQHQEDYLNAITDVLVAESKGIWNHLPAQAIDPDSASKDLSQPPRQNLTLIEASLYHYFGMQKEAEKRYKQVIDQPSTHLPTAFLLLTRYYYQQQDYKNVLKWVQKVDVEQLSEEQKSYRYLYELDAHIRLGQKNKAEVLLDSLDDEQWFPVLAYNAQRMKQKGNANLSSIQHVTQSDSWFTNDPDELEPLLKELEGHKFLQQGMDAAKANHWATAVVYFKQVPPNSIRTVEARRWLAWSLMKDGQLTSASKVWRSLTRAPSYQALDAVAMSASVTEQLGDKEKALAWFEKGIDYYADQVETLAKLRSENQKAVWFTHVAASNDSFWSPAQITITTDEPLFLWAEDVWQNDDFQQALSDHRDLVQIAQLLTSKTDYVDTFGVMVENRRLGFEKATRKMVRMDAEARLKSYQAEAKAHRQRVDDVADYKDIFAVGTKEQLINQALLERVKENIQRLQGMKGYARKHDTQSYEARYEHLERINYWEMREAFPSNYRRYRREVNDLTDRLEESNRAYEKMIAAKDYAPTRFKGYSEKIADIKTQLAEATAESVTLRDKLKNKVITMLDDSLAARQKVAQRYLEQSILASARLRDELAFELGSSVPDDASHTLAMDGGTR